MDFETMLGDGYVVAADDWMNVVIVWNGHSTFNVWSQRSPTDWANCDVFTYDAGIGVENVWHAKQIALTWIHRQYNEMEQYFGQEAA